MAYYLDAKHSIVKTILGSTAADSVIHMQNGKSNEPRGQVNLSESKKLQDLGLLKIVNQQLINVFKNLWPNKWGELMKRI